MPYGIIKVDTVTFTNDGVDKSVTLSGLVQNPTFSGNVTVTGTFSGVTVTGTTANFTSGNFTNISGGTHTITSGVFAAGSAASPSITFTGDLNTGIYSPGADQVAISTNGANRFQIDSSGNITVDTNTFYVDAANNSVGIGTTSPGQALSVAGNISSSAVGTNYVASSSQGVTTSYLITDTSGGNIQVDGAWPIRFTTNSNERARIDSSGRLLVGTSSDLSGGGANTSFQLAASSGSGVSTIAQIYSFNSGGGVAALDLCRSKSTTLGTNTTVANNDYIGSLNFKGANGSSYLAAASVSCEIDGAVSGGGAADMPGRLVFSTTADGASSPTERMRIDNVGRSFFGTAGLIPGFYPAQVVISATNATEGLDIHGTNSTGTNLSIWAAYAGAGTLAAFWAGTTRSIIGAITHDGTNVSYNTSSDYRLKENVTPVTDGIARLQQLKPSRFNFIADPTKTVDGFIAHEVQSVVPECVTGEKDAVDEDGNPQYQGIDQSKLVPLLTAALQEAVAKIESLEARLTAAGI